jgi:hypothetical protein
MIVSFYVCSALIHIFNLQFSVLIILVNTFRANNVDYFKYCYHYHSAVDIENSYGLDVPGFGIPKGARDLPLLSNVQTSSDAHTGGTVVLPLG